MSGETKLVGPDLEHEGVAAGEIGSERPDGGIRRRQARDHRSH